MSKPSNRYVQLTHIYMCDIYSWQTLKVESNPKKVEGGNFLVLCKLWDMYLSNNICESIVPALL